MKKQMQVAYGKAANPLTGKNVAPIQGVPPPVASSRGVPGKGAKSMAKTMKKCPPSEPYAY